MRDDRWLSREESVDILGQVLLVEFHKAALMRRRNTERWQRRFKRNNDDGLIRLVSLGDSQEEHYELEQKKIDWRDFVGDVTVNLRIWERDAYGEPVQRSPA